MFENHETDGFTLFKILNVTGYDLGVSEKRVN